MSGGGGGGGFLTKAVGSGVTFGTAGRAGKWGITRRPMEKYGMDPDQSWKESALSSQSMTLLHKDRDPDLPDAEAAPTMEDIAAKEPDKERRRRQRMAMLMAQGRQGTILTGPGGITPNNLVGGGGKQMVGA